MEAEGGIAPYRIDAEIAHSSLCTIYRAYEESLDRPVLIKKLHPQMAREEDIRKRFEREAQVCARVKHENIVDIYSYRADPDVTMLVMEFIEGRSLGELLREQGRIGWPAALAMLAGVLKGLGHAHAKGVTHRDIKPDNLLLSGDGRIKITDFGLATVADAARVTMQGAVVGTPAYLPPEQVSGGAFDQRGDLFSVGVTFYEALTGISPFSGQSFSETLKRILTYSPPPPSSLVPDIPPEFDQILERLLEKQPSRRFATAEQALEEVKRLAQMRGVSLEPTTVSEGLSFGVKGSAPPTPISLPPNGRSLRARAISVWAVGIVAAAASLLLFVPQGRELVGEGLAKLAGLLRQAARPVAAIGVVADSALEQPTRGAPPILPPPILSAPNQPPTTGAQVSAPLEHPPRPSPGPAPAAISVPTPPLEISTEPGRLTITSRPWAAVTIDNVSHGQTPLGAPIELKPGRHLVALTNPEFPTSYIETVEIPAAGRVALDVNLWSLVGVVQVLAVKPWAEIFVDGVSYGMTPRAKPIIVPFGRHTLELRNPAYQLWKQALDLTAESPSAEISATLAPLEQ